MLMMPTPSTTLAIRIMRRVHAIWFVKRALPVMLLEVAAIVFALMQFAQNVHVANVFRNIAASGTQPGALAQFMLDAFLATDAIVEGVIVAAVIASLLFIRSMSKSIRAVRSSVPRGNFSSAQNVTLS